MVGQTEVETVETEGKANLRQLLAGAGNIMDHPWTKGIAEAASSPKAADEYVKLLGWPNVVACQMRYAVRLRDQFPEVWQNALATDVRPVDAVIGLSPGDLAGGFRAKSTDECPLEHVRVQTRRRFGRFFQYVELPLLLRDLAFDRSVYLGQKK